ncbi:MAG: DNA double-strand break repair nuclease NurA [Candidatus Zixiibacteriota bacterium]
MQSETREYNVIDDTIVRRTASEIQLLFRPDAPQPALSGTGTTEKAPPLIDDITSVPPVTIRSIESDAVVYAIDGGSSVIAKGGNVEVICWRAGYVCFKGIHREGEFCESPNILAYNRLNINSIINDFLAGTDFKRVMDETPLSPVNELRWMSEWMLLRRLIDEAPEGSLILMDGTLRANPFFDVKPQHDLFKKAAQNGIHIASVTKTSSLSLDKAIPIDIMEIGADEQSKTWYRQLNMSLPKDSPWLGDVYLAGLHPGADKRYRVDINRYDTEAVDRIFSILVSVSDDTEFAGYPYPLVAAHRQARIDLLFKQSIIEALGEELNRLDFSDGLWHFLTGDIHDKLNADVLEIAAHEQ